MLINITTLCHQQPLPARDCCPGSIAMSSARSNNGWPPASSLRDQYQSLLTQLFTTLLSDKKEPQAWCPLQTWGRVVIAGLQQDKVMENGLTGTGLMKATTATTSPWDEIAPCSRKGWGWTKINFPEMAFGLCWAGSSEPLQLRQPTAPGLQQHGWSQLGKGWDRAPPPGPMGKCLLQPSVLPLRASKAHLRWWGPWSM